jgi:hypothetical protein
VRNIRIADRSEWVTNTTGIGAGDPSLGHTRSPSRRRGRHRLIKAMIVVVALIGLPAVVDDGIVTADAAGSCVRIRDGQFNAPGSDHKNLNGEWVRVQNRCEKTVSLKGWRLRDLRGHTYRFPSGTRIGAGKSIKIHTGSGTAKAGHLYWGRTRPVWNNKASERAYLLDRGGLRVSTWPRTTRSFVLGVNLNGPSVEVDGRTFRSHKSAVEKGFDDGDPNLSKNGVVPRPDAKEGVATLLESAAWSPGTWRFRQKVAKGTYELFLYTKEDDVDHGHRFAVRIEGKVVARDVGTLAMGEWKRWGPFTSTVTDGTMTVDLQPEINSAHLMAFEVWKVKKPGTPKAPPKTSSTPAPEPAPTVAPTPEPTAAPTATPAPTATATPAPTVAPTTAPAATPAPTVAPTTAPAATPAPTTAPTPAPTPAPTKTPAPTAAPTPAPTPAPTKTPSPTATPAPASTSPWSVAFLSRPNSGPIRMSGGCDNLVIENRTFKDLGTDVEAIHLERCNNVTIRANDFARVAQAITVLDSTNVKIEWNRYLDILGPHERVGKHRANFVQLVRVTRGSISHNKGRGGDTEDIISMYKSGGSSTSPFIIEYNHFEGTNWTSPSGSGIALGDEASAYSIARYNTLLNVGQVGMFIAGGTNHKILDNVIYGERRTSSNVGLYVWNQYAATCSGHEVRGNRVSWRKADGSISGSWNGGNCGTISGWSSNDWNASLDPAALKVGL